MVRVWDDENKSNLIGETKPGKQVLDAQFQFPVDANGEKALFVYVEVEVTSSNGKVRSTLTKVERVPKTLTQVVLQPGTANEVYLDMDNPKHLDMDATLAAGQEVTGDDIVYVAFVEDYGTVQMQGVTHSQAQVAWADSSDWADTSVLGSGVPPYNVDETTVTTVDGDWQSQFAKAFIQGIESAEAEMDRRIKAEYVQFVVWNDNDLLKSVNVTYVIDGNSYIVPARWDDTAKKFVAYVPDAVTNQIGRAHV